MFKQTLGLKHPFLKLKVLDISTNKSSATEVAESVFARDYNQSLVHQVTTAYMAASFTSKTLSKAVIFLVFASLTSKVLTTFKRSVRANSEKITLMAPLFTK
jgi:hypothetical protein